MSEARSSQSHCPLSALTHNQFMFCGAVCPCAPAGWWNIMNSQFMRTISMHLSIIQIRIKHAVHVIRAYTQITYSIKSPKNHQPTTASKYEIVYAFAAHLTLFRGVPVLRLFHQISENLNVSLHSVRRRRTFFSLLCRVATSKKFCVNHELMFR